MAWGKELFNKPTGSEVQIDAANSAEGLIFFGEAVITILVSFAIGLLPPELAPAIIKAYAAQLLAVGLLGFGYLDHRLDNLRKIRSQISGNKG